MFPQNQNTGDQVTGADDDFSAFVRQAVAEEIAKTGQGQGQNPLQGPPQNAPTPIPVSFNGQTVTFNNPEELNAALAQYHTQMQAEVEKARNTAAPPPKGGQVTGQEPDFDITQYVNYMTTDPIRAADYIDEKRFGIKNPAQAIKDAIATKQQVGELKQALDVYRFRDAHPEFSINPQNAQTLQNIISQASLPSDYNGLEAAYAIGLTRGMIQVPPQEQFPRNTYGYGNQQVVSQPQFQSVQSNHGPNPYQNSGYQPQQQNWNNAPPPRAGRNSSQGGDDLAQAYQMADSMTPEQLENIISRFQ